MFQNECFSKCLDTSCLFGHIWGQLVLIHDNVNEFENLIRKVKTNASYWIIINVYLYHRLWYCLYNHSIGCPLYNEIEGPDKLCNMF